MILDALTPMMPLYLFVDECLSMDFCSLQQTQIKLCWARPEKSLQPTAADPQPQPLNAARRRRSRR